MKLGKLIHVYTANKMCVCVCVCERERERERRGAARMREEESSKKTWTGLMLIESEWDAL